MTCIYTELACDNLQSQGVLNADIMKGCGDEIDAMKSSLRMMRKVGPVLVAVACRLISFRRFWTMLWI